MKGLVFLNYFEKMFRFIIVSTLAVLALAIDLEMLKENCAKILTDKKCCTTSIVLPDELVNAMKECSKLAMDEFSCERDICVATKVGFIKDDNKVEMAKAEEMLKKYTSDNPDLLAGITKYCVNGDYSKYGPPSMCDLRKYRNCIEVQQYSTCTDWSNDSACAGAKEAAGKCAAALN